MAFTRVVRPFAPAAPALSLAVLLALLGLAPGSLEAQSLFSVGGLGVPVEGLDARARALGSIGLGLPGFSLYQYDPAGSAGVPAPLIQASMQPTWGTVGEGENQQDFRTTRFPHIALAYPVGLYGTAFVSYSGYLDQRWRLFQESVQNLGGEPVTVTDDFESNGGIASFTVGWAQQIGESFGVGISAGLYTGRLRRKLTRTFESEAFGGDIDPYILDGEWTTTGPLATLGVRWDPWEIIRVAASVEWSGDLKVEPQKGTERGAQTVDIPLVYRIGASASLTPTLALVGGFSYQDWEGVGTGLGAAARPGSELSWGSGLEFTGASLFSRELPLRLGYRRSDFPFQFEGEEVKESYFAFGLGYVFARSDDYPTALIDLTMERGRREAGVDLEEFWRATFTLRLSGG